MLRPRLEAESTQKWSSCHPNLIYLSSSRSWSVRESKQGRFCHRHGSYYYHYVRQKIECPQTHKNDMVQHLAFWRIPLFFSIESNITPDYQQRIYYFMLLSIVNDYEKITGKNSIMSACNLSYRLKRSGP